MDRENIEVKRKPRKIGLIVFVIILALLIIGMILVVFGITAITKGEQIKVKPNSTLVLNLNKPIQELPVDPFASQLFGSKVLQFSEVHDALKRAKNDERIKSVLIVPSPIPLPLAKASELKKDIEELKKSKTVIAYFNVTSNSGYYLASSAHRIYAPPSGMLFLSGLYAEMPFLKDMFDKIKVEPQLYHIGPYKSYSDMFTRKEMSDAQREAMDAILDSLYKNLVSGICQSGRFKEDELKSIIDKGLQTGDFLKQSKLVDDFKYPDDVEEELKIINGNKGKLNKIDISAYIKDKRASFLNEGQNSIAVVIASGEIVDDGERGDYITPKKLCKMLDEAKDDKDVKAIVLRVDSPGGSGLASDIIWDKINRVKKVKPVIVSMSSVAGSGGYYISMGADGIVAEPTTITGSIGVVTGKFVFKGLSDWAGINFGIMKRGENADLFSPIQRFTPEQEKIIVGHMESFYKDFVSKAAIGRKKSYEEIDKIAQGRIWSGEDALKIGLVDRLGGLDEAIEFAKEKANIKKEEKVNIKYFPKQKTFFEFFKEMSSPDISTLILKIILKDAYSEIEKERIFIKLVLKEPILYYTPFEVSCN